MSIDHLLGKVHNCDCMELMKQLPDKCVDLVLTDPPYGINADKMQMGSGKHEWAKGCVWDGAIPDKEVFEEIFRIGNNAIIWGGNYFTQHLPPSKNWLIWDKCNPNLSFSEAEIAWVGDGKLMRIFKHYSALEKKQHPTQKPFELFLWCLNNVGGQIVFDPFMGSGTTAVACERLGRKWFGCELEPKYCQIANKRIEAERAQLKLF